MPDTGTDAEILDQNQLLGNLKKTLELWFQAKQDDVIHQEIISSYESTIQVRSAIKSIILNGLKLEGFVDSHKNFINDLNWLQASTATAKSHITDIFKKNNDFLSSWIFHNMQLNSLCSNLQFLVADKELLETYYSSTAFLRNEKYSTALFICLSAFELKQSSLLSQIDTSLYNNQLMPVVLTHKRSTSHPNFSISPKKTTVGSSSADQCFKMFEIAKPTNQKYIKRLFYNRKWKSLPNIHQNYCDKYRQRSKTFSQAINIPTTNRNTVRIQQDSLCTGDSVDARFNKNLKSEQTSKNNCYTPLSTSSSSASTSKRSNLKMNCIKCNEIKIHFDRDYDNSNSPKHLTPSQSDASASHQSSLKSYSPINFLSCISSNIFSPSPAKTKCTVTQNWPTRDEISFSKTSDVFGFSTRDGEKINSHISRNIFDEIVIQNESNRDVSSISSRSSMNSGQNLTTLLQSHAFSGNNTELEKENAHFKISETIISVIEHMKWSKAEKIEEIKGTVDGCLSGNETIKIGENSKSYKNLKNSSKKVKIKEAVETATSYLDTSQDADADAIYYAESASEGDCDDSKSNLNDSDDCVAYAEWGANGFSAEGVALSLISKFADKQLPKVSELIWLVSEEDTKQKLLPLPDLSSQNPDEHVVQSTTRGTRDWAPPRQQIIFTDHPNINRKNLMKTQNYRCAGCGMRVSPMYMSRFRYCTYLGKYHCTGCHRNHMSAIPAKILNRWDFTLYPVSVFSYRLLEQIWTYPLFYISNLSPTLYGRVKILNQTQCRRNQLKFLKDFITTCRFASTESFLFASLPEYLTADTDKWSISDFINIKNGKLIKHLDNLIKECEKHVYKCELCTARGFFCELCSDTDVIYPWQVKVKRCNNCGTCFHSKCWKKSTNSDNNNCVKCQRLIKRQEHLHLNEEFMSGVYQYK